MSLASLWTRFANGIANAFEDDGVKAAKIIADAIRSQQSETKDASRSDPQMNLETIFRRLKKWWDSLSLPPTPGGMYLFWEQSGMSFTGHVLLPAFTADETNDDIPKRRLTVTKDDGTVLSDVTFPSADTEKTFGGAAFGDKLTLSLWDIDEAGNPSATPSVLNAEVTDTTPPATPGQLSVSFTQDGPAPAPPANP